MLLLLRFEREIIAFAVWERCYYWWGLREKLLLLRFEREVIIVEVWEIIIVEVWERGYYCWGLRERLLWLRFKRAVIIVEVWERSNCCWGWINYYYLYSLVSSISRKTGNSEIHLENKVIYINYFLWEEILNIMEPNISNT